MSARRAPVLASLGANERLGGIVDRLPAAVAVLRGAELVVELANPRFRELAPGEVRLGRPLADALPPEGGPLLAVLRQVLETGETGHGSQQRAVLAGADAFFDFVAMPLRGDDGQVEGAIVHAVEVTELVRALRRAETSERRFRVLVDAEVVGVVVADQTRMLEANAAFLRLVGRDREALERGEIDWRSITPPEWEEHDRRALEDLGRQGWAEPFEKEYLRPDGRRVPVLLSVVLLDEAPWRAIAIVIDRSAERAAERERERLLAREREARREAELAAGRATRLQRVTAALSAATSAAEIGRMTLEQAMEALDAPAGTLAFPDGDGLRLVEATGYESDAAARWERFPLDAPAPLARVVRTGQPVFLEREEDWGEYPDLAATLERFHAFAGVPFPFGATVLGGMALSFPGPRSVSAPERGFLVALGRLAAQALERTRLFEQRGYVARMLQQGLLPERLAEAEGLEVAVRYHSIADGGEVGGDFYDFFDVGPEHWVAATGDVAGKGTAAAVLTGLARHTLRAIALRDRDSPAEMLRFLDEAIRRQSGPASFCTVGCAAIERREGGFRAVLASGGHPYPVLVRAGGAAEEVEVRGTLLGVQPDPPLEELALDLAPGDLLVSYTDGVTDARDARGVRFGEERLLAAVDAAATGACDAEAVAAGLDAAVADFEDERRRDDRAILVLRVRPDAPSTLKR
jgi:PAS domain S-box-containing protein